MDFVCKVFVRMLSLSELKPLNFFASHHFLVGIVIEVFGDDPNRVTVFIKKPGVTNQGNREIDGLVIVAGSWIESED